MILIALCGAPGAGKTEVQNYLSDQYDVTPVDDGASIRDIAMRQFGLSPWHVRTQEGKASNVVLPGGNVVSVRTLLGEIGNFIEKMGGPDAIPAMAIERVHKLSSGFGSACSFGSVRRQQGHYYKGAGATVVEIVRLGYGIVNEFDQYDPSCVDITIHNDSSVSALRERVEYHLGPLLRGRVMP